MRIIAIALLSAALTIACGNKAAAPPSGDRATGSTPAPYLSPGGMWMPHQLPHHAATLRALGLELDPARLADPSAAPLAAIISLGGCSASFVSPEGLIITNHHCVTGALQRHSKPASNLVESGFLAKTKADEKSNGPTSRIWVTRKLVDVTDRVLADLGAIADDQARYQEIDKRTKELLAACEQGRPELRCRIASYFGGAHYYQVEMLEIRDVRLVYAPDANIGQFGGDDDNWMWPRHGGDYAFYRAYVGSDGKPADYSKDNVPYRPRHYLHVADQPLREGDLVMIAGYPGVTFRFRTAAEVRDAVTWYYPRRTAMAEEYLEALQRVSRDDPEAAIKAQSSILGLQNMLKANRGMVDGLVKGALADKRAAVEADLGAWIKADRERTARYGTVLEELEALRAQTLATRDRDATFAELRWCEMLDAARLIVRLAEERPKPDGKRHPRYQQRNWKGLESRMVSFPRRYNRSMDRAIFATALRRGVRDGRANAAWLAPVLGDDARDDGAVSRALKRYYAAPALEDDATRLALLKSATSAELQASSDPFIQLALALRPLEQEIEARDERHAGAQALLQPRYMRALIELEKGAVAPDANSTLRVSFGTVQGYRPRPDAEPYTAFTTLPEVIAKHRGVPPYNLPARLRKAAASASFGPYRDAVLGEVPVDFLANLDTTGGGSGSATLNQRGELVGLAFDGNYEAMASDWLFIPELSRSIHADIRYVLWIMDAVDNADHLLEEMGVTPAL